MQHTPENTDQTGIDRLLEVVATLRGEDGCPWDREQTLDSLKQYLVEESYELIDAIDSGDAGRHKDELGDVLLQVALQSQIRAEKKEFTFDDVARALAEKLIVRHPHVFGDKKVSGAEEVVQNWENIKSKETQGEYRSAVEGLPRHLPSLQKAQRVQSRASRVGFDWAEVKDVVAKVDEELEETKNALDEGNMVKIQEEIGDLLFAVVNLSRFKGISAEEALESTTAKFIKRFKEVEKRIRREGRDLSGSTLEEMDKHWEDIKKREKDKGTEALRH